MYSREGAPSLFLSFISEPTDLFRPSVSQIAFRPWSDLLKRVAGAPRGADRGRNNGKSESKHPLGATGNMPTRSSAVLWAQEGVHLCHLDRNTGDHGENPFRPLTFFEGGAGLHFREKKKSLFSRKNVRRLLCWYSGCAGAMQQVQNKKFIFSPLGRALAPRRRGTCVFFSVLEPQGGPKG